MNRIGDSNEDREIVQQLEMFSLSLGERAGVRASVNKNYIQNVGYQTIPPSSFWILAAEFWILRA
jgi:hypothetical protein